MSLFKKGTVFVYYETVSSIPVTGVVARHYQVHSTDGNGITTIRHYIESTSGEHYAMNCCFEVVKFDQNTAWYNEMFKRPALLAAQSKLYI